MEPVESLFEGEWSSLCGMFSNEEADFMAQMLGNYSFLNEQDGGSSSATPSTFLGGHEAVTNTVGGDESLYYSFDTVNSNLCYFPQGSSYSSGSSSLFLPTLGHENYYVSDPNPILATNDGSVPMDFCIVDEKRTSLSGHALTDNLMEEAVCLNDEMSSDNLGESDGSHTEAVFLPDMKLQPKRKSEMAELNTDTEEKDNNAPSENSRKISRVLDVQKNKKNVHLKKIQKLVASSKDEEESNAGQTRQSSSSDCSEDELNGGVASSSKGSAALNLNGKTRAGRGSATDPQSLYARKRRERINERLRILQNLVPNGTKVDISTMLDEAVQYVKFLQLQIKLLSSDDLWMYSPIAYNGMDIGLDLKISQPR